MPEIHATAHLEGDVRLADDVVVGPGCVLTGAVEIGAGTRLVGNAYLHGPITMGRDNTVYPFSCLGFAPQSLAFDHDRPGCGLRIGDGKTFREGVTVHRAMTDEGPTTIGSRNYMMASSHAAHDVRMGDGCVLANGLLAGHVVVEDDVNVGGLAGVHQHCRIGRGAMVSGDASVTLDVAPHLVVTGANVCPAVNRVGLRRRGMSGEEIDTAQWAYRTLCRRGLLLRNALEVLRERAGDPIVDEYIRFCEASERGICTVHGVSRRGTVRA